MCCGRGRGRTSERNIIPRSLASAPRSSAFALAPALSPAGACFGAGAGPASVGSSASACSACGGRRGEHPIELLRGRASLPPTQKRLDGVLTERSHGCCQPSGRRRRRQRTGPGDGKTKKAPHFFFTNSLFYYCWGHKADFPKNKRRTSVGPQKRRVRDVYKIGRTLGTGGFSVVKLGVDKADGTEYALKVPGLFGLETIFLTKHKYFFIM